VLVIGAILVAFPPLRHLVASTLTSRKSCPVPMPLLPGSQFIENYSQCCSPV